MTVFINGPMDHHLRALPDSDKSSSGAKRLAAGRYARKTTITRSVIRMITSRQGTSDAASTTANPKRDDRSPSNEQTVGGLKRAVSFAGAGEETEQKQERDFSRLVKKVKGMLSFGDDDKKTDLPTTSRATKSPPTYPRFERGPIEPYQCQKVDPLCPVTANGHLREEYVKHLIERVGETANRDAGWTKDCLGRWFGQHLQQQVRYGHGGALPDRAAHFLAAVDLHRRMSTDPRVPRPAGEESEEAKDPDLLWFDVVDAMNAGLKLKRAVIMHTAGTTTCTLGEFVDCFAVVVAQEEWNRTTKLRQFPDMAAAIKKSNSWRKIEEERDASD
jgi:hypothetical protein